jgi:hypothetical protein
MRIHMRLLLATVGAACALAVAVSTAAATRIELSNNTFRIVWAPITITEGALFTECPLTLEGTFHSRTFSKVSGQLLGFVTRAIINELACNGAATARVLEETLPWHVRYNSFTGTLPNITGINFQIIGLTIQSVTCVYRSTEMAPARVIYHIAGGEVTNVQWDEASPIPKREGGVMCPAALRFQGNGIPTVLNSTTRIRARLVA